MTGAALALGTAQLGMAYGVANRRGMLDGDEVDRILDMAIELGVRLWDTAPAYGCAEARIGDYLRRRGRPEELRLCSKLSRLPERLPAGAVAGHVRASIESSLRTLGCDRLAAVLVHDAGDLERCGDALADALAECQRRDLVDAIGVSIYDAGELPSSSVFGAVQFPFNVFTRRTPPVANWLRFARSALVQGAVALAPEQAPPALAPWLRRLHEICADHQTRPLTAALGFAVANSGADYVLVGVEAPDQLADAVDVARGPDRGDLYAAIETALPERAAAAADPRSWGKRP